MDIDMDRVREEINEQSCYCDILYVSQNKMEHKLKSSDTRGEASCTCTMDSCRTRNKNVLQKMGFNLSTISVIFLLLLHLVNIVESLDGAYSKTNAWYAQREYEMVNYLGQFGYIHDASRETGPAGLTSKEAFVEALKRLQRMGNIPETGVVDRRTAELMAKPRCGNKDDVVPSLTRRRRKRYVTAPSKWQKSRLTYRILNSTPDLSADKVRRILYNAFKVWSDVTTLSFSEVISSDADILIQFAEGYHHDGYPFDGKGSVLAHAFFPGDDRGGDTHFDDAETWTFNSSDGVDLFMVAAHEFGHALGLAHSSNTEALMYPWYQGYQEGFKLPYDDVAGIQSLYGSKSEGSFLPPRPPTPRPPVINPNDDDRKDVTPRPTPRSPDDDGISPCTHSIDAITVIRKEVFIFIGSKFWRLGSNGMGSKPTEISKFWYNLPTDGIDALYERADGKIVFFKGDRFWMFNSNHMVANFPKEGRRISELGMKDVKKVDAVFVWDYNKRTYLITGDMYWKLNDKEDYIEYDYPRDMGIWRNVPVPVDSAFRHWNGKTYFLKGDQQWEFYDYKMKTKRKEGRAISKLLGCRNGKLLEELTSNSEKYNVGDGNSANSVQIILSNLVIFVCSIRLLH